VRLFAALVALQNDPPNGQDLVPGQQFVLVSLGKRGRGPVTEERSPLFPRNPKARPVISLSLGLWRQKVAGSTASSYWSTRSLWTRPSSRFECVKDRREPESGCPSASG
jgi:hypothetical protein